MIEYFFTSQSDTLSVKLDGKVVGHIKHVGGWQYKPIGTASPGDIFPSVAAVKKSLEAPKVKTEDGIYTDDCGTQRHGDDC